MALGRTGLEGAEEVDDRLCSEGGSGEAVFKGVAAGVGVEGRITVDPVVAVEREDDEEREPGELDVEVPSTFILLSSRLKSIVPMPTMRLFLGLWALDLLFGLLMLWGEGLSGEVIVILTDVGSVEVVVLPWLILVSGDNGSVAALFRSLLLEGAVVVVVDVSEIVESEWSEEKPEWTDRSGEVRLALRFLLGVEGSLAW